VIHELKRADYERVRPLFRPLAYHLASAAVLDGTSSGRIFVDDPGQPRTAFMLSPEGCYLAGDPEDHAFNVALNRAIIGERVLGDEVNVLCVVVHPEGWHLETVLEPYPPVPMNRRHYVCRTLGYDWRDHVPPRYTVHRIDRSLLDRRELIVPDHVTGWMANNWGSIDRFLRDGFGFAAVGRGELVSWSLSDCVSDDRCEIGIRTALAHRRRGLATVTAAAAVEHALSEGFSSVGWHCPDDNLGSIGTAENVGFQLECHYTAYHAFLDQ
jgi:GNAT superfamily N-acetyltransferase